MSDPRKLWTFFMSGRHLMSCLCGTPQQMGRTYLDPSTNLTHSMPCSCPMGREPPFSSRTCYYLTLQFLGDHTSLIIDHICFYLPAFVQHRDCHVLFQNLSRIHPLSRSSLVTFLTLNSRIYIIILSPPVVIIYYFIVIFWLTL